jgi:hypothetical protein
MLEGNRNQNISEFATFLDVPAPQIDRRLTLRSMSEDMIGQRSDNNLWEMGSVFVGQIILEGWLTITCLWVPLGTSTKHLFCNLHVLIKTLNPMFVVSTLGSSVADYAIFFLTASYNIILQ